MSISQVNYSEASALQSTNGPTPGRNSDALEINPLNNLSNLNMIIDASGSLDDATREYQQQLLKKEVFPRLLQQVSLILKFLKNSGLKRGTSQRVGKFFLLN